MARINRSDVIQKAVNDLSISIAHEKVPNETLDKVQLVYALNKQYSNFVYSTSQTTTGAISLATTAQGGETYLTNISASFAKDATCDISTGAITIGVTTDLGVSKNVAAFAVLTLTADSQTLSISFAYPLKIKTGSSISMAGTFSVGALSRALAISGFNVSST